MRSLFAQYDTDCCPRIFDNAEILEYIINSYLAHLKKVATLTIENGMNNKK